MQISIDGQVIATLSETKVKAVEYDFPSMQVWIERYINETIANKLSACFDRIKKEWEPKLLARGVTMVPTDKEAFAELVFSQPDYKNRSAREAEAEALRAQQEAAKK